LVLSLKADVEMHADTHPLPQDVDLCPDEDELPVIVLK